LLNDSTDVPSDRRIWSCISENFEESNHRHKGASQSVIKTISVTLENANPDRGREITGNQQDNRRIQCKDTFDLPMPPWWAGLNLHPS
jgi:hypothetical protein